MGHSEYEKNNKASVASTPMLSPQKKMLSEHQSPVLTPRHVRSDGSRRAPTQVLRHGQRRSRPTDATDDDDDDDDNEDDATDDVLETEKNSE